MKEETQDELQLEDLQKSFKQKVFEASRNFLQHCETINPIFIYLFILLEALQILWFSIHPALIPLKNPVALEYVRTALSYINFETPIAKNNDLLLPFVALSFGVVIVFIITLAIAIHLMGKPDRNKSELYNIINRLAAFEIIVFNTILIIPIFNVSVITLYCDNESMYHLTRKCYNAPHIILCVLASLNVLVIIFSSIIYWFVFYLRNPFSKSYYALSNNLFRLGKLILKILPPLYFVVDVQQSFQSIYTVIFVILSLVYIGFFRFSSIHNFYENYFYLEMFLEAVIAWFCVNAVICFQIESSGMNFIESTLCSFIFAYAVCSVEAEITRRFFVENLDNTVKKQDREKFIYLLIGKLFQENAQDINPLVYIKMLNSTLDSPKVNNLLNRNDLKVEEVQEVSREVMLALLEKFLLESPSINLRLVKCQLLFDCGLRILSLHEVSELRNDKLETYEEFMIFNFKSTHKAFESGEIKGSEDNITEIETYLNFIENMNEFESELEFCALNNEQYWEELCEDTPSSNKVYNLAKRSMKYTRRIEEMFKKIEEIFPENLTALILYFQFLNDVCVRYKECNKIKEKLNLERQRQSEKESSELENHNLKIKFKANERMCVLHVSTTNSSMGIVQNCNSEVKKYLGFEKSEIINQKVTKIMPKIYTDIHDGFIDEYLKKADAIKLPVEKTVFALKKNLKIIETCLAVKIFPNVQNGFQLVGFFKEKNTKEDIANIMINMKTLEIEGMTEGFLQMAGNRINLTEIQKEPLKLSHLFPEIDPNHKFAKGETISTMFRFSDCTDRLIDFENASAEQRKKFEKKIFLQVEGINYYQGSTEIGILNIKEEEELVSLQDTDKLRPSDPKLKPQRTKAKYQKREVKSFADSASQDQISIERKIEDFISTQSNETRIFFLLVAMILFFFAIILSSVLLTLVKTSSNYDQESLLEELSLASNISIIEGRIVNLNKDMTEQSHNPDVWNHQKELYAAALTELQTTIITLFEKANERKESDLIINTFTHYNFFTKFKGSDKFTETSLYYTDGIQQAVFLAKSMINEVITNFNEPVSQNVYETSFFVESNFKEMLPKLANETVEAYRDLLEVKLDEEFLEDIYIVSAKAGLFLLFYFILCFFLKKFSSFNNTIIQIYNHILKWDAYELYSKCVQFRSKNLEVVQVTSHETPRSSDIFKVFPKSLLVLLSQGILTRNNGEAKTSILAGLNNSRQRNNSIENNKEEEEPFKTKEKTEKKLESPNKGDLIHLTIENKMKKKYIVIFLVLLVLMGINFIFVYVNYTIKERMANEISNILTFASFSKSFLFLYFYGSQYIDGKTDYLSLYNKELVYYYNISKEISVIIADNQMHLQDVSKEIELLNSLVRGDLASLDQNVKKAYIDEMETKLFDINNKVMSLSMDTSSKANKYLNKYKETMRFLKMGVEIILVLIFYKLVQVYLFSVVQNLILHSSNMMKMVPTWIVHKSKLLKDIVCGNQIEEPKLNQKKINMDSSANMMINSSV